MAEQDIYDKIGRAFSISGAHILRSQKDGVEPNASELLFQAAQKIGLNALDIEQILNDPDAEEILQNMRDKSSYKHKRHDYEESGLHLFITRDILFYLAQKLQEE